MNTDNDLTTSNPDETFYNKNRALIPQGIYYEAKKTRWRVRLYKKGHVVYRRYFKSYGAALHAYTEAKQQQATAIVKEKETLCGKTATTRDLIHALKTLQTQPIAQCQNN